LRGWFHGRSPRESSVGKDTLHAPRRRRGCQRGPAERGPSRWRAEPGVPTIRDRRWVPQTRPPRGSSAMFRPAFALALALLVSAGGPVAIGRDEPEKKDAGEAAESARARRDRALAHYKRGTDLHEEKRLDQAIAAFSAAIDADPTFAASFQKRGQCRLDK